jgi:sugar/nucleoside kinase (ribokinase family)
MSDAASVALAARVAAAPPRVACVGVYIVDVLGRPVASLPDGQGSLPLDEIRMTAAGTAGGTSVDLARMGASVLAVGAAGEDRIGDFLLLALRDEGVETEFVVRKPGVQTSATILPIRPNGDRPAWHVQGANALLGLDDIPWERIDGCDALHLGGISALRALDGAPSAQILKHARERGLLTSADCLGVKRDDTLQLLEQCLPYVDLFLPNDLEALRITGESDVFAAARRFHALGARCVVVTTGADGCVIVDGDGERALPAFKAPVVDTTGCGDAFSAGVIVATCAGWPIDRAAQLGGAAAALTMRGLGSDAGARTLDEVLRFMHETPLHEPAPVPAAPQPTTGG